MNKPTTKIRIIAGEFGGRHISATVGQVTHPMGDRVRTGLFNALASRGALTDATCLDAFAGTGAVGLEAISRGAAHCDFIERDQKALRTLESNVATLNVADRTQVYRMDVAKWAELYGQAVQYDIIFADSPYDNPQFSTAFLTLRALKQNGLMVLSHIGRVCEPKPEIGVVVVDDLIYGEATLTLYRKV